MRSFSLIARSLFILMLFGQTAEAQSVALAWDPSLEPDIAGYTIVWGTASRSYTRSVAVGKNTAWTVDGLTVGQTYYFAVVAHNNWGIPSLPSAEVSTTLRSFTSQSELLWRHATTGELATWGLEGNKLVRSETVAPGSTPTSAWRIVGMGDFNGDAQRDIVWQHTDGRLAVWLMNGAARISSESLQPAHIPVDPYWKAVAVGDMNSDGYPDLLWQHAVYGWLSVWFMRGKLLLDAAWVFPSQISDLAWQIVGTGDFNRDGKTDLLFRHAGKGNLAAWLMDGNRQIRGLPLTPDVISDLRWKIRGVVDVNDDAGADIVWQHDDGRIAVWVMDGLTLAGGQGQFLDPPAVEDLNWKIVAGR
jgi:hypothetical protein